MFLFINEYHSIDILDDEYIIFHEIFFDLMIAFGIFASIEIYIS